MQIIDQNETSKRLPMPGLIEALRSMFREGCEVPLRHAHTIDNGDPGSSGTLLLMPAWQPGRKLGLKTVSIYPGNRDRGLPGLHSTYLLLDAQTGVPLAMLDGDTITSRRTAAASALAAQYLSRPDASTLLLVGTGRVAAVIPQAYSAVRPIRRVLIWNVRQESARRLAAQLKLDGYDAEPTANLETAVAQADIVSCATLSTAPLIRGKWLRPGTHLDLIGSFKPTMRESDNDCYVGTSVFVDTDEALLKAGDLLEPVKAGVLRKESIRAQLVQLCRGQHAGRQRAEEITVFKAVGNALEDLAAACLATESGSR
ncbi:ornithine cyclodeaminase family protein [Bordetella sp. FB-8]|uniref:ornithine cyclodeaminase family protein n=1 Tax=Bordetella sp. FB-8 TaxID=1159870 RepID=UPI00037EBB24|nr:ornithine cyclodeaminase family protein [Bordetella sp. FB-8]